MSFFSDLESAVITEATSLWHIATTDIKALWVAEKPLIEADAKALGLLAVSAVLSQAGLVLRGSEKLSAAVTIVLTTLATEGKTALLSDIEIAIQVAYNTLNGISKLPE